MKFGQIRGNNFLFLNLLRHSRTDFISSLKYLHITPTITNAILQIPITNTIPMCKKHYHRKLINALLFEITTLKFMLQSVIYLNYESKDVLNCCKLCINITQNDVSVKLPIFELPN
jgi:hypothetical protein